MSDNKKSYYAIIPANVRYDKSLNANAKLLYGEITALCNEKGYCWASNAYFADLYEVSTRAIQEWLKRLRENGYINIQLVYKNGEKEVQKRIIRISQPAMNESSPGYEENFVGGTNESSPGYEENFVDNTTLNTTTIITSNKEPGQAPIITPESADFENAMFDNMYKAQTKAAFEHFWQLYDYKVGRGKAEKTFNKINPSHYNRIMEHVKKYVLATPEKQYRKHPDVYLRNKCWTDEIIQPAPRVASQMFKERNAAVESMPGGMARQVARMFDNINDNEPKKIGGK